MRVLLTGYGTLGRTITRLRPPDWDLTVMDVAGVGDEVGRARPDARPAVFVRGDVRDPSVVREACRGVDAIIHTAGPHGIHLGQATPAQFTDVNVSGTIQLLEAAVEQDVRRFVFSSTVGVLGARLEGWSPSGPWLVDESVPPLAGNVYVLSKILAEQACDYYARTAGRETVVLRYGRLREEGERLGMEWALSGQLTDVRDAAAANVAAVELAAPACPVLVNLVPPTVVEPGDAPRLASTPAAAIVGDRLGLDPAEVAQVLFPPWAWLTAGPATPAFARFEHTQADFIRDALQPG